MSDALSSSVSTIRADRTNQQFEAREHAVWNSRVFRTVSRALIVGLSYYVGTRIGFALTPSSHPISTFWPPNAILLGSLLISPTRTWWVILLAVFPAHLIAQMQAGVPVWTTMGWFMSNASEALLGAYFINLYCKGEAVFESVRGVLVFLAFGVVLAPLATSFLDAAVVVGTGWGSGYWGIGTTRFFTNTLAELTLVPSIVMFGSNGVSWLRKAALDRYLEAGLLIAATVLASSLVFGWQPASPTSVHALMYVPLPLLLWGAIRFGSSGLSLCLLSMALTSLWNVMHGRGPFTSQSVAQNVLSLQILLCMVAIPLLLLAALMVERRHTEEWLRRTSGRLINAQEQERHRIARELHDDLGQKLALVQVELDALKDKPDISLKERLTDLSNQLSSISTTTREISHGLHPSQLEYLGLAAATKRLCGDVGRGRSLSIQLNVGDLPGQIEPTISLCLYRVVQEALHNIVAHSQASKAEIDLRQGPGRILLRIIDNGIGFTPGLEPSEGLGLISMRERVRSIEGSIDITSFPKAGTRIVISVPVRGVTDPR